ncbi:hypothetical protein [Sphingomonas paeninsulae]|uniref:hypothetical protein n=1 Tax=Sphingomonas paeninsulae TaxID=2319844 RepID=UPI0026C7EC7E
MTYAGQFRRIANEASDAAWCLSFTLNSYTVFITSIGSLRLKARPNRFAAVASFHGGNLATDAPGNPYTYAPKLKAELYIAAAENNGSYPLGMAEEFENELVGAERHYTLTFRPVAAVRRPKRSGASVPPWRDGSDRSG